MSDVKAELKRRLGRDVTVEQTTTDRFICQFVDYMNPHPASLVGDTEELAYQNLLSYLEARDGKNEAPQESPQSGAI